MFERHNLVHLFEQTSVIVAFMKGPDHVFEYVNSAHIKLLGKDVTGLSVREAQPEIEAAGVIEMLDRVFLKGETVTLTETQIPIGNETHYFDFVYTPSRDASGTITGVMALVNDITERVRDREKIIANEAKILEVQNHLARAVQVSKTGFFDWDIEKDFVVFSSQMKKDWGFEANATLAEVTKLVHPEDQDPLNAAVQKAIAEHTPYNFQYRVVKPTDGQVIWVEAQGEVTYNDSGQAVRFFGTSVDITERKVSESRLATEKHKMASIFNNSPALMALWRGPELIYEQVNPQYQSLFRGRELVGKPIIEALPELKGQPFIEILQTVLKSGESYHANGMLAKLAHSDNEPAQDHYFNFTFIRMLDEKGNPYGVFNHAVDVTREVLARKNIEDKENQLTFTKDQLVLALDSAELGTWQIDLRTNIVTTSPIFAKIFGVEKVEGDIFEEIGRHMHPDDVAEVNRVWTESVKNRTVYSHEYRIVRPNGTVRWVNSRGTVNIGPDGNPTYFSGVLSDVTERVVARIKSEESEARIKQVANAMPQIVWTSGPSGVFDYTNDRWTQYSGSTDPTTWLDYVHHDDINAAMKAWSKSVMTGENFQAEFRLKRASDQAYRWFLVRAQAWFDNAGKVERWIGTCTDIEEQKNALALRSEFMSIASHELKTPLTSLILQTQLMRRNLEKPGESALTQERVEKLVNTNEKQIRKLVRLVDDMLDFSKIEAGKLSVSTEKTEVSEMVSEVCNLLRDQLQSSGSQIEFKSEEKVYALIDRLRMEQVITNLLTNSTRYGLGKPILVQVFKRDEKAMICIQDHGMGISPDNIERIFNRFERAVSANEVSGLGLGLYISREIVSAHGGKIWAESVLGKGSTFCVELPVIDETSA